MSGRRKITGRLGYNPDNGRYGLLVADLWERDGFYCGDGLEVMVDGKWVASMTGILRYPCRCHPLRGILRNAHCRREIFSPFFGL